MNHFHLRSALALIACAGVIGTAQAQTDVPAGLHTTSETWTLAGSPYRLKGQVYFTNNSTLTIEAGVVVASLPADQGSLAITRGSQIFVNGTATNPVIMTSTNDTATWVGGDPKTGTWRAACNEWGNLTIMGNAYISENAIGTNTATPNAANRANMEGLSNGPTTDQYGGGNDDDDSGSITYLSLRYGGKVVGLTNELNGLSLGGIGRATEINHVDIMNNIDDGIEIWGGTVNLSHLNIWNIGDDSVDVDQGYRGKMQYGLIVQGYSVDGAQGSGVGDNLFETDGAEQSDYQPVTTAVVYNFTVIGQPTTGAGDHGMAFRDNARVQYRNCIFMDLGDRLVSFDNVDGDGGAGYGFNGTLSWANTWTTPYNAVPAHANDPVGLPGFYAAQASGNLIQVTDCVMYNNNSTAAYTEANARGVFNVANNNVLATASPITSITRGPNVPLNGGVLNFTPVIGLDPRPANDALTSVGTAPNDGFLTAAPYRGGFAPRQSWLGTWTASYAYGYTPNVELGTPYCFGDGAGTACPCGNNSVVGAKQGCINGLGVAGQLRATGVASISADSAVLRGTNIPNGPGLYFQAANQLGGGNGLLFGDGLRCAAGSLIRLGTVVASGNTSTYPTGTSGANSIAISIKGFNLAGDVRNYQLWYRDSTDTGGGPGSFCTVSAFNLTNALNVTWQP